AGGADSVLPVDNAAAGDAEGAREGGALPLEQHGRWRRAGPEWPLVDGAVPPRPVRRLHLVPLALQPRPDATRRPVPGPAGDRPILRAEHAGAGRAGAAPYQSLR